jgi:hypothetical protein
MQVLIQTKVQRQRPQSSPVAVIDLAVGAVHVERRRR